MARAARGRRRSARQMQLVVDDETAYLLALMPAIRAQFRPAEPTHAAIISAATIKQPTTGTTPVVTLRASQRDANNAASTTDAGTATREPISRATTSTWFTGACGFTEKNRPHQAAGCLALPCVIPKGCIMAN